MHSALGRLGATAAAALLVGLAALPAVAADPVLELPAPVTDLRVLPGVGVLPERLLVSAVPGPVRDDELVEVEVDGDGTPATVTMTQRLALTGTGDYVVRERGPARLAEALDGTVPPVLRRGTVVWQGFSPGRRDLAARLRLDAGIEAERLPVAVRLDYQDAAGTGPLGPGGSVARPGTLTVTLVNQTVQAARELPAGDVPAAALAGPLATLRAAALAESPGRPPAAGSGLPPSLPVSSPAVRVAPVAVPLRVTGTVTAAAGAAAGGPAAGAVLSGPGTEPGPGGGTVAGTLTDRVSFTLAVPAAGTVAIDLTVRPVLDPRALEPPDGRPTWAAWAASDPPPDARRAATDRLVDAAAASALLRTLVPYLGADLPGGDVRTDFRYTVAPATTVPVRAAPPTPKPGAIAVATLAAGLVLAQALAVRRLS